MAKIVPLEKKGASLRAEIAMALRVQVRMQSNQQDLQKQFADLKNEKNAQDTLVMALVQKLEDTLAMTPPEAARAKPENGTARKKDTKT